jgi:hypothetical protein
MPWGKFENTPMAQVPARYLLKLFENPKLEKKVKSYISENFLCLIKETETLYFKTENLLNYNA